MRHVYAPARAMRSIALLAILALIVVACGQKPGVRVADRGQGGGTTQGGEDGDFAGEDGFEEGSEDFAGEDFAAGEGGDGFVEGDPDAVEGTSPGGGQGGGQGGGDQQQGGSAEGGGDQGGGGGGTTSSGEGTGSRSPSGSDRTGASDDKITLGIHAPVTGAAPLPVTSFEKSRDLYWKHVINQQGQTILGRTEMEVLFRDDKYDPSSAVQVCRELASKAFFLVGGGGTDQIQACGRFSNQAKVPYFSAGVTEKGLRGLEWYFATSMSYKQQGPLLAQYVRKNLGGKKVAAVVTDTPNFDDAVQGWEQGVQRQGLNYYKTLRHPKGDSSWYNSYASDLRDNGVEVVYINTAPVDYIRFAQQADQQGYRPQFVGVGITMGLNAVLGSGCPEVDGGIFLSPFPGLDWARNNEQAFFQAGQRNNAPTDDIALALWGLAKTQHELFKRYGGVFGNDLTREDFRAVVEQQSGVKSGLFPSLNFSPQDHFGANAAHVLRADCSGGEHRTVATFATGF